MEATCHTSRKQASGSSFSCSDSNAIARVGMRLPHRADKSEIKNESQGFSFQDLGYSPISFIISDISHLMLHLFFHPSFFLMPPSLNPYTKGPVRPCYIHHATSAQPFLFKPVMQTLLTPIPLVLYFKTKCPDQNSMLRYLINRRKNYVFDKEGSVIVGGLRVGELLLPTSSSIFGISSGMRKGLETTSSCLS